MNSTQQVDDVADNSYFELVVWHREIITSAQTSIGSIQYFCGGHYPPFIF